MAVWCCDDALDLFVARIDVDHTAGESEGARALPFHRRLTHKAGKIGPAVHKGRVAGSEKIRTRDLHASRRVYETVTDHVDLVGDDVGGVGRSATAGGVFLNQRDARAPWRE